MSKLDEIRNALPGPKYGRRKKKSKQFTLKPVLHKPGKKPVLFGRRKNVQESSNEMKNIFF